MDAYLLAELYMKIYEQKVVKILSEIFNAINGREMEHSDEACFSFAELKACETIATQTVFYKDVVIGTLMVNHIGFDVKFTPAPGFLLYEIPVYLCQNETV